MSFARSLTFFLSILIVLQIIRTKKDNIDAWFDKVNAELLHSHNIASRATWAFTVNTDTEGASIAHEYYPKKIAWQQQTCDKMAALQERNLLNDTQKRMKYLLCRGPVLTLEETRQHNRDYAMLEAIYNNVNICIESTNKNITKANITAVEDAIVGYVSSVAGNTDYEHLDDPVKRAVKYTVNEEGTSDDPKQHLICISGETDFEHIFRDSRNETVLRFLWLTFREAIGPPMREYYRKFVDLENVGARRQGYSDIGEVWREELEMPDLRSQSRQLYEAVEPLYKLLHGVMRYYLRRHYGNIVPEKGPIPAHLLGNPWAENWQYLVDMITPNNIDIDKSLKRINWTVNHLVKGAEDFYQSLGLPPMTEAFWKYSVFEKKTEATQCHGTSADLFQKGDFRMIYCSGTTAEDFYIIHHEMGHIHYYMAYEHQPVIFRQGTNSAFHESIGDSIMYGVLAPQHLHRLGLINDSILYSTKHFGDDDDIYDGKSETNIPLEDEVTECINKQTFEDTGDKLNTKKPDKTEAPKEEEEDDDTLTLETSYETDFKLYRKKFGKKHARNGHEHDAVKPETSYDTNSKQNTKETDKTNARNQDENDGLKTDTSYDTDSKQDTKKTDKTVHKMEDEEDALTPDDIFLLKQALNKIPQIPFALVIEEYRWEYFEGAIKDEDINRKYWEKSLELQGIAPIEPRGEEYFDVSAKFHVPDNTPYIRYFLTSFLQNQLFEAMCKASVFGRKDAKEELPPSIAINRCDIYGSKAAGKILKDLMTPGASEHWQDVLRAATGQDQVSAEPLKRFYRPLYKVLEKLVQKHNIPIGW